LPPSSPSAERRGRIRRGFPSLKGGGLRWGLLLFENPAGCFASLHPFLTGLNDQSAVIWSGIIKPL